ncbi:hypothetical protein NIES4071_30080 [Calothrix sp. NIES-4071]|nr:hypothetical protein NIES4071_30080 [Calothrix sp. NIES-4071]BAZ57328.1 hypothetical protein NIES4105_30020 [Calothrix sp. NIES-4105]
MSESYEVLVLIPEKLPVKEVVYQTHQIISEMGGYIDEDCMLILNDTKDISPDIEYIYNDEVALNQLINWPALGGINYAMPDAIITVEYAGEYAESTVQAIRITIPDTIIFALDGSESKDRYASLASVLHERLRAKRTIVDWGLMYRGIYWKEEIERLNNGEYLGNYSIDLRAEKEASKQGLVA